MTAFDPNRYVALRRRGQQLAQQMTALQQDLADFLVAIDEELWLELIRPEEPVGVLVAAGEDGHSSHHQCERCSSAVSSAHVPAAPDCAELPDDYGRRLAITVNFGSIPDRESDDGPQE